MAKTGLVLSSTPQATADQSPVGQKAIGLGSDILQLCGRNNVWSPPANLRPVHRAGKVCAFFLVGSGYTWPDRSLLY